MSHLYRALCTAAALLCALLVLAGTLAIALTALVLTPFAWVHARSVRLLGQVAALGKV